MKNMLMLAMTMMAVGMAKAELSVVYWSVDGSAVKDSFSYVMVRTENDEYLHVYSAATSEDTGSTQLYADDDGLTWPAYSGNVADYTGRLIFEIWSDADGDTLYESLNVGYDAWSKYAYSDFGRAGETPLVLTLGIPEPTGGMLALFGLALLALRRKSQPA